MGVAETGLTLATFVVVAGLLQWLLASGLARRIAIDRPNERSLHELPVPRIGGLVLVSAALGVHLYAAPSLRPLALIAAALMLVSAWDDRQGLSVRLRLAAHLAAALLTARLLMPGAPAWLWLVAVLALAWAMNLYNFMDGSDGLAGGMTVIGFTALALASFDAAAELALACSAIAAAAAGFLVHNFHPARVFLGDAGSIPIGFLAGAFGIAGIASGAWPPWFPVLVFLPFITDASLTLGVRLARGHRPWQAHREHAYQRMVAGGFGHRDTALAWYGLMFACAATALVALRAEPGWRLGLVGGWVATHGVLWWLVRAKLPANGR